MKNKGTFTISLDFELYWGVFEKVNLQDRLTYFRNTREVIPRMLELFNKFNVHVTWATVGMLFAENWEEWEEINPVCKPNYLNQHVNPYRLQEIYGKRKELEFCFFAPDLIKQIISSENQELASHTYSHYFCQEEGQDEASFDADLEIAVKLAKRLGVDLKSLVFPRNQIRQDYLKICSQHGIEAVRSNPIDWYWNETGKETLMKKVFRTGDAFIPLGSKKSYKLSDTNLEEVIQLKASRFLRPYSSKSIINALRLRRILKEMESAAIDKEHYHLWWHPHNFGTFPQESLAGLEIILNKYKELQLRYGMQSFTMKEISNF
ncbi:polysaccharide deacetylase family protein [Albibacterium bauzanense]|uniref:Polysaccharide deacetylase n=1 Tax=Albibacterium bauzanense TaxID=653929 RepID=A0A4R1M1R4_9SPHI|nr:polysaccharide deacetylase family protein [Albibacterium bauzanense]TCK84930.1 polysaccharide deacetylase [Albibacterium bauzanense]